ncbi:hypothetical protein [Fictibacillus fluitans]|uniref:Uncharacterized protein n=1 Tax=Fictibacillus fluitans TaxID=3058422 RepID=A0ABT8HZV6_9BACL|nr:hypothetical protein [Fictibacillus sp. NE201]MDN4526281.1 hypothetical protein [Fictibacillus sp. NE201]
MRKQPFLPEKLFAVFLSQNTGGRFRFDLQLQAIQGAFLSGGNIPDGKTTLLFAEAGSLV